jgi:hypothetical protein
MSTLETLRELAVPWAFSALLPLPILLATDPAQSIEVKCVYLGLACGLYAIEVFRPGESSYTCAVFRSKLLAVLLALSANVALFIVLGRSIGVAAGFPFPVMAILSSIPALGLVPWLSQRVRQSYAVLLLGATMVFCAKLAACVVARFVYGPDYMEQGRIAGDWHTAKLMISLYWILTVGMSLLLLLASYRSAGSRSAATPEA